LVANRIIAEAVAPRRGDRVRVRRVAARPRDPLAWGRARTIESAGRGCIAMATQGHPARSEGHSWPGSRSDPQTPAGYL
jgi:hypothetical protein